MRANSLTAGPVASWAASGLPANVAGKSFESWPVDLVIFDSEDRVGEREHVLAILELRSQRSKKARAEQLNEICNLLLLKLDSA